MHSYSPDVTEPTCVQILQPGYKVGERILRPGQGRGRRADRPVGRQDRVTDEARRERERRASRGAADEESPDADEAE